MFTTDDFYYFVFMNEKRGNRKRRALPDKDPALPAMGSLKGWAAARRLQISAALWLLDHSKTQTLHFCVCLLILPSFHHLRNVFLLFRKKTWICTSMSKGWEWHFSALWFKQSEEPQSGRRVVLFAYQLDILSLWILLRFWKSRNELRLIEQRFITR